MNSVLGSTLEVQVVDALNHMRDSWDPPLQGTTLGKFALYSFVRMPQSFPDVRLQKDTSDDSDVLFGIELKGWYLLGKEGEPSYRFKAHALASGDLDMLVVIPWYLRNVLSGRPVVLKPYIAPSSWAAAYRDWYWEWKRDNPNKQPQADRGFRPAPPIAPPPPYPQGKSEMSSKPISDSGGNFGRFSRAGLMDEYIGQMLEANISGIRARDWVTFFKAFTESRTKEDITAGLQAIAAKQAAVADTDVAARQVLSLVHEMLAAIEAAAAPEELDLSSTDALEAALRAHRAESSQLVGAATAAGMTPKRIAKITGLTPKAVELLAAEQHSA